MAEFDDIARMYDTDFTQSEIGKLQRNLVWDFFRKHHHQLEGEEKVHLLEMNCGTGEDALFFAKQNIFVTATDISGEMLEVVQKKVENAGLRSFISIQKWDLSRNFPPPNNKKSSYQLAFSNFGGWNCLEPKNIPHLAEQLSTLLAENGRLFLVIMPRFCVWESLYFLYKRKPNAIFRRLSREAIPAKLDTVFVDTYYYSPAQIQKMLSPYFTAINYQPIGFFIPPSYLEKFFRKVPNLLAFLNKVERIFLKLRVLAFASDHFIMVLQKNKS